MAKTFSGLPGRHSMGARGAADPETISARGEPQGGTCSIIPARAARDRRLGRVTPLHVLSEMGKYRNAKTGLCVPAIGTMARDLGVVRRSVQRHIHALIEAGYVVAEARRDRNGSWTSNSYILLYLPLDEPAATEECNPPDSGTSPSKTTVKAPGSKIWAGTGDATFDVAYPSPEVPLND